VAACAVSSRGEVLLASGFAGSQILGVALVAFGNLDRSLLLVLELLVVLLVEKERGPFLGNS
jgi:hypothetical protein